jgi:hypothetical protein
MMRKNGRALAGKRAKRTPMPLPSRDELRNIIGGLALIFAVTLVFSLIESAHLYEKIQQVVGNWRILPSR